MATGKSKKIVDEDEEEEAAGGGKKKILLAVAALAIVGGVYKLMLADPAESASLSAEELAAAMSPEEKAAILEPPEGEIVQMEEMILNLAGPEEAFLKIRLALVLDTETLAEEFELELPIAQDVAVLYLSSLKPEELQTAGGKQKVKDELTERVKVAYKGERVMRVLITELVMQ